MKSLSSLEFPSYFVSEDELNDVVLIEVYSFYSILIVPLMNDPPVKN